MREQLLKMLVDIREGRLGVEEALERLRVLPFEDLGYAKIDHHRNIRRGFPEVIFCQGKTAEQLLGIVKAVREKGLPVLGTRCGQDQLRLLAEEFKDLIHYPTGGIIYIGPRKEKCFERRLAVVTAGTADMAVAEEAAATAECLGIDVERFYDMGVAGIHRLFAHLGRINEAAVIIVTAGMEGALPGVVAGLTDKPVIAVPTSVGYGVNFQGLSALLTMLSSCSGGIGVVNIDNGFGAAYLAALIIRQIEAR